MDFQAWLDNWAETILPGDYDRFREMSVLPFEMVTPKGSWSVTDETAYRAGYDAYRDLLTNLGVTLIVRTLRQVPHHSDDEAVLIYDNYIMRDSLRVMAPSGARASLRLVDGQWRAYRVEEIHSVETVESPLPVLQTHNLHMTHTRMAKRLAQSNTTPRPGQGATGDKDD